MYVANQMPTVPLAKSVLKVAMQGRRPAAAFTLDNAAWASVSKHPGYITPSRRCRHTRSTARGYLFGMHYRVQPSRQKLCSHVVVIVVPHIFFSRVYSPWSRFLKFSRVSDFSPTFRPETWYIATQGAALCNIIETGLSAERVAIFDHCNTNINRTGAPSRKRRQTRPRVVVDDCVTETGIDLSATGPLLKIVCLGPTLLSGVVCSLGWRTVDSADAFSIPFAQLT